MMIYHRVLGSFFTSMFKENFLDGVLHSVKKLIPKSVFDFLAPAYHWSLSMLGALIYGFPSRTLAVIGVTGTKGKSTTVYMIAKIFEAQGLPVAAIGSLGFKIRDRQWPNTLKMTMPGRLKLQKFLARAREAGVKCVILEVTSEGLAQHRLAGVKVDCAVFTNLHREHLESHGSFGNYLKAKQKLFLKTGHIHVLNMDDAYFEKFANYPVQMKVTYGRKWGLITPHRPPISDLRLQLLGDFNEYNALAALAVAEAYRLDLTRAVETLNSIESIPGRMEVIESPKGFKVIIDYAHTPDSLEAVYKNLRSLLNLQPVTPDSAPRNRVPTLSSPDSVEDSRHGRKILDVIGRSPINQVNRDYNLKPRLVCVLGAAGGGRDKWKRPEFGRIAAKYCDEIILTNEDPYDESPIEILDQVESGVKNVPSFKFCVSRILDRGEAIKSALTQAQSGDIVVITGKGSETSIAVAGGKKIPWSDREAVIKSLV